MHFSREHGLSEILGSSLHEKLLITYPEEGVTADEKVWHKTTLITSTSGRLEDVVNPALTLSFVSSFAADPLRNPLFSPLLVAALRLDLNQKADKKQGTSIFLHTMHFFSPLSVSLWQCFIPLLSVAVDATRPDPRCAIRGAKGVCEEIHQM